MTTRIRPAWARRATALGAASVITALGLAATAPFAAAAPAGVPGTSIHVKYKVTGSTFLAGPNFTLALGPGKLASTVDSNGKLTATLSMPNATGSFKEAGVIPVTATTQFINDGPTTGKINLSTGAVATTSKITLRIVSLSVASISVPVGPSCETKTPAVIKLKSEKGFNVVDGGKLGGTYAVPDFHKCLLATLLIDATLSGQGNTITLKLGKAKLG
jgi:hypothetical protein